MLIYLCFFDNNDIFSQIASRRQLQKLREEKSYYRERIEEVRQNYRELSRDPKTMEKYARERYFMKKADEEIFLIVEDKSKIDHSDSWIPQTLRNFFGERDSAQLEVPEVIEVVKAPQ